jgi:hypothetical protein
MIRGRPLPSGRRLPAGLQKALGGSRSPARLPFPSRSGARPPTRQRAPIAGSTATGRRPLSARGDRLLVPNRDRGLNSYRVSLRRPPAAADRGAGSGIAACLAISRGMSRFYRGSPRGFSVVIVGVSNNTSKLLFNTIAELGKSKTGVCIAIGGHISDSPKAMATAAIG